MSQQATCPDKPTLDPMKGVNFAIEVKEDDDFLHSSHSTVFGDYDFFGKDGHEFKESPYLDFRVRNCFRFARSC